MRFLKKERDFGGDFGRKKKKSKESKDGQLRNSLERHDHGEKTPEAEISSVLRFVMKKDLEDTEMRATKEYINWLKNRLEEDLFDISLEKFGEFEKLTASVKAGGGGRQTSRNSRARTHLITGIREKSEKDRKAYPNEMDVMNKIGLSIKRHLENWRIVIKADSRFKDSLGSLEDKVLEMMVDLEKK